MFDGKKMKAIRIKRKMSQEAVAQAAKVSHYTIHRLESGKYDNPRMDTVTAIAKALLVNREDLITED
jgi:DNA-binding XRE family transcriptional regulator